MLSTWVVANSSSDYGGAPNQLLLGSAMGGFEEAVTLMGGSLTTLSVALGDVDGDGHLDIVFANWNAPNQLLHGQGDGSFMRLTNLPGGSERTYSAALGDVNGDGKLDIVFANDADYGEYNQLLLSSSAGSFAVNYPPSGRERTWSVALGDLNRDGNLDIVFARSSANNLLLLGDSMGGFAEVDLPGGRGFTRSVALGDVIGDGRLDIVFANHGAPNQLLLANSTGGFAEALNLPSRSSSSATPHVSFSVALADVDRDGRLDIVTGNEFYANELLLGSSVTAFSASEDLPGGDMRTLSVALADVDRNGRLDIVFANEYAPNQLLLGSSTGGFAEAVNLPGIPGRTQRTTGIAIGDVNEDGHLDIVFAIDGHSTSILQDHGLIEGEGGAPNQLLLGSSTGGFAEAVNLPGASRLGTYSVALGDVDGDGNLDIVFANNRMDLAPAQAAPNQLLLGRGNGTFAEPVDLPGGSMWTSSVALGDVDGDTWTSSLPTITRGRTGRLGAPTSCYSAARRATLRRR